MSFIIQIISRFFNRFPFVCHQLPGRSPHFCGTIFPLCFRCAGLHIGLFSSYLYIVINGGWKRDLPDFKCVISVSFLMVPFFLDSWGNALHLWSSPGWLRALTGLGYGLVLPLLLIPLMQGLEQKTNPKLRPSMSHPIELIWPTIIGFGMAWFVIHPISLKIFKLLALVSSAGVIIFLANFLLVFYFIIRGFFTNQFSHKHYLSDF